jgi:hypothetical protein
MAVYCGIMRNLTALGSTDLEKVAFAQMLKNLLAL